MASTATATATTPQPRGPLAHIVDALRLDNRQLLLETLQHDPRLGANAQHASSSGAGSGSGGGGADSAAGSSGGGGGGESSATTAPSSVVEQQLVFGSADLRRVVLRQVMNHDGRRHPRPAKKEKKGGKKKSKNVTQAEEEEEIMKDWNEELRAGSGGGTATQIVGTRVLSPAGDGAVVRAHGHSPDPARSTNPFGDDEAEDVTDRSTVTTYVLRGGGFDLPSLSAAALHRRRTLAAQAERRRRQPKNQPHGNNQPCGPERVFRFIFVPRMTETERAFLNELGVKDDAAGHPSSLGGGSMNSLESLPVDLIPLDDDVLSLELTGGSGDGPAFSAASLSSSSNANNMRNTAHNNAAAASMKESDKSGGGGGAVVPPASAASMRHSDIEGCEADVADIVARSLMKLQLLNQSVDDRSSSPSSLKGAIGRVQGLGPLATAVIDRMMTLRLEEERLEVLADEEEGGEDEEDEADMQQDSNEGMNHDEVFDAAADEVEITAHSKGSSGTRRQQQDQQRNASEDPSEPTKDQPSIQALLVIDRKIDLVTPMLTPLTYEGLIDDVLHIQVGGCVSVKKSIVEPDDDGGERPVHSSMRPSSSLDRRHHDPAVLVPLNDTDPLYTEVRDRHVETFGSFLQNQAKALKESHSQFTNRETAHDLTEIHRFVKQIPVFSRNLRSLTNHIHIAELVKAAAEAAGFRQRWQTERSMLESEPCYEVLEDLLAGGEPPYRWLRLFCLQSLTSNGIKATRYDSLRREVVQTYGYEFLMVLRALEKAGFLRKRETFFMDSMQTPYSTLRKALNLINADVDPSDPEDVAYVSSGYAPMTVRWVQAAMGGYVGLDEALRELPAAGRAGAGGGGRLLDVEQRSPPESLVEALKRKRGPTLGALAKKRAEESRRDGSSSDGSSTREKKPVLLVYFVGGVTFMELAALRFLSKRPSFPYYIACCTTEIVNGGTLLRSLSC